METIDSFQTWTNFQSTNRYRRAIREFNNTPIAVADMISILNEARLSPSSVNLQPYQFHWIRNPDLKKQVAQACNGQKSAATATEIIVVVASTGLAQNTITDQLDYIDNSTSMPDESKDYHRKHLKKFTKVLNFGGLAVWTPLVSLISLFQPSMSLLPIGHLGSKHWAARNAIFAAHTLMLAAASKGIDSCPMEGFSAPNISKLLSLPRGAVIPVVIALGHRSDNARVEEQWRRRLKTIVVEH